MSTKIYDGFIIESKSLEEIHEEVKILRNEIDDMADKYICEYIMRVAMWTFDRIVYAGQFLSQDEHNLNSSALMYSQDMFEERERDVKLTRKRDPEVDLEFVLLFFPLEKERIIGMMYCEQRMFKERWMSRPFVNDYSYWNNTDPDSDCTTEEWNRRREDWNKALEKHEEVPSMNGVTMTVYISKWCSLFENNNIDNWLNVLEYPVSKRAQKVITSIMRQEYFIRNNYSTLTHGQIVALSAQFEKDLRITLKDEYADRCAEMENQMKPFTRDMLLKDELITYIEDSESKEI